MAQVPPPVTSTTSFRAGKGAPDSASQSTIGNPITSPPTAPALTKNVSFAGLSMLSEGSTGTPRLPPSAPPRSFGGADDRPPQQQQQRIPGMSTLSEALRAQAKEDGSAQAMQQTLERKLDQVEATYEEFFDDVGLAITHNSKSKGLKPTLPLLVNYMRRVPIVESQNTGSVTDARRIALEARKENTNKQLASFANAVRSRSFSPVERALFRRNFIVSIISMTGVLLMLIASILAWKPRDRLQGALGTCAAAGPDYKAGELSRVTIASVVVLNYLIFFTSLATLLGIVKYYQTIHASKQIEWCRLNGVEIMPRREAYSFWRSSYPKWMFLELFIHIIIPYPWYNSLTEQSDGIENNSKYLELCMLMRVYTILRVLHHWSPLYRLRHDIVAATPELKSANFTVNFTDTMKVYCYEYTIAFGLILYAFVTLIGGFAVFVAERDSNNGCDPIPDYPGLDGFGYNSWYDGVYFMVVSVRTIGYGDLKPITIVGRIATMLFVFAGMAVEAFLGSVVINKIAQSREEKVIVEYLDSFYAFHELRIASVMLIQATWKTSLRYRYRHSLITKEYMERVLRTQKRRRDCLLKFKDATSSFPVATYDDLHDEVKALRLGSGTLRARIEGNKQVSQLELKTILMHFRSDGAGGTGPDDIFASSTKRSNPLARMPYLMQKEEKFRSQELVERYRRLFTQDVDLGRWSKFRSKTLPQGVKGNRTFTATKKVVGKMGERRIPVGTGHKADILLEAQKTFRQARLRFKQAMSTSADHVIDGKLLLAYELLVNASEKVTRNALLLKGLRSLVKAQLDAVDELVRLALSGGE